LSYFYRSGALYFKQEIDNEKNVLRYLGFETEDDSASVVINLAHLYPETSETLKFQWWMKVRDN
jgi:hypothetical protein